MPSKNSSGSTAKKKSARPAAKKAARRSAPQTTNAAPAAAVADRLTGVARTIGSKVGGIVAKTKKVLKRGSQPRSNICM